MTRARSSVRRWLFDATGDTLEDLSNRHRRGMNFFRLLLALLVLYSHAPVLGGFGPDAAWPTLLSTNISFGSFAVGAFFALSGFFVGSSAWRSVRAGVRGVALFVLARMMRLMPALLLVLVVVAFVVGPVMTVFSGARLDGYFSPSEGGPVAYVLRNMFLPINLQWGIFQVFDATPYGELVGSSVNGSLWTLPVEIRCYALAIVCALLGLMFSARKLLVGLVGLAAIVLVVIVTSPSQTWAFTLADVMPENALPLLFTFVVGMIIARLSPQFLMRRVYVFAAALVFVTTAILGGGDGFRTIGISALVVLLPALAALFSGPFFAFFTNDLSYGTYLWAFPIQQSFAQLNLGLGLGLGLWPSIVVTTLITLCVAAVSWFAIEKPSLQFVKRKRAWLSADVRAGDFSR